jgi:signal transduction histidine kinase
MTPTDVRATISGIIAEKYRSIIFIIAGLLVGLWFTLSAYAINNLYQRTLDRMYGWILVNKSKVEEGLFLSNNESLRLRLGQICTLSDSLTHYDVALYDADKKTVLGTLPFPASSNSGMEYNIPMLRTAYFDSLAFAGKQTGYLYVRAQLKTPLVLATVLLIFVLCSGIFLTVKRLLSSFTNTLDRRIVRPIVSLRESMNRFDMEKGSGGVTLSTENLPATEIAELYLGYSAMLDRIREYSELEIKRAEADATFRVAAQVAHDIRSPLTALKTACSNLGAVPPDVGHLIRLAADRINEIANNLIENNRAQVKGQATTPAASATPQASTERSPEWLALLIENLMLEKRLQFQSTHDISFQFQPDVEAFSAFGWVDSREFKRMLSNLLNNAAEAIPADKSGKIEIFVRRKDSRIDLEIVDNGKGIPPEVLPKLTQLGFSFDKKAGTGLGLHHCKTTLESWGGTILIESVVGQGTRVTLSLEAAPLPGWFLPELHFRKDQVVVVIDDDKMFHELWRLRFAALADSGLNLIHLYKPEELEMWLGENPGALARTRFLVDYDFAGSHETGLDLIRKNSIYFQSVLVTGQTDLNELRNICASMNVRLLPKSMAASVPIRLAVQTGPAHGAGPR